MGQPEKLGKYVCVCRHDSLLLTSFHSFPFLSTDPPLTSFLPPIPPLTAYHSHIIIFLVNHLSGTTPFFFFPGSFNK